MVDKPGRGGLYPIEMYKAIDTALNEKKSLRGLSLRKAVEEILGRKLDMSDEHWSGITPKFVNRFLTTGSCIPPRARKGIAVETTIKPVPVDELGLSQIITTREVRVVQRITLSGTAWRELVAVVRDGALSETCNIVIDNTCIRHDVYGCTKFLLTLKHVLAEEAARQK